MNLIIDAYRGGDVNAVLSDPQNVRMAQLWIENHPRQVSLSPMLKDIKSRVFNTYQELDFDKLPTKDLGALPEESIRRLSKSQILRLSALSNFILPPYAQNFRQILQTKEPSCIKELTDLTEEEKDAALAHYIEHLKIPLRNIKLTDAEVLRLAPHLRYLDLRGFNITLAKELLQKCTNLNGLLISNGEILNNVSALTYCRELDCAGCTNLQELPELPLCEKLICVGCTNLKELPELPLCEKLYCGHCSDLQELPELPFCKELYCGNCTKLLIVPALPLCKELDCKGCKNLLMLEALPLCKKLDCWSCTSLPSLPALPLCETLICRNCTNLEELPPTLPLCKELNCWNCTNLEELPELPLCNELHCGDCSNLVTLPLSLGQNAGLTTIDIYGTEIEPAVRDAILNQCRLMRNAEAANILPSRLAKWQAIAKNEANLNVTAFSDDQKKTLNDWLLRLERTKDFHESQSLLAETVCKILADLLKNAEFQELFFPQAEANNACCGDRAAMSLNEIYTSWMALCKSWDLHMLTGVAKTLCLRKELQKLIGNQEESVEIFLYYESTLRVRLGLQTAIQNMTHGILGKRNWINEDKLVENVEAHFFEELFELPVFQKRIVFDDSEFLNKLGECPAGGPNDTQVLNYQHRQGEIMLEWRREKMRAAKLWYKEHI